jgi:hypothetical protein
MDGFDECKRRLLAMGYSEPEVDAVLARMKLEEEIERAETPRGKSPREEDLNSTE